jgi:hypothetical protein
VDHSIFELEIQFSLALATPTPQNIDQSLGINHLQQNHERLSEIEQSTL